MRCTMASITTEMRKKYMAVCLHETKHCSALEMSEPSMYESASRDEAKPRYLEVEISDTYTEDTIVIPEKNSILEYVRKRVLVKRAPKATCLHFIGFPK